MKQQTINRTTWGFVEVPEGSENFYINRFSPEHNYLCHHPIFKKADYIKLPPGHWSDPIKASEVTEEQAAGIVEGVYYSNEIIYRKYLYTGDVFNQKFKLHTATESIYSLIRSLGMEPNRTVIVKQIKQQP